MDYDYWFEDLPHFKGFVMMNEASISLLEAKVGQIRNRYNILNGRKMANINTVNCTQTTGSNNFKYCLKGKKCCNPDRCLTFVRK